MASPKRNGRPPAIAATDVLDKLLNSLGAGNFRKAACLYAGIGYVSFWRCMEKGRVAKSGEYFEFRKKVLEAEGRSTVGFVGKLAELAMKGDVDALKFILTHGKNKKAWAPMQRTEISGLHGGPVAVDVKTKLDVEAVREELLAGLDAIGMAQAMGVKTDDAEPMQVPPEKE